MGIDRRNLPKPRAVAVAVAVRPCPVLLVLLCGVGCAPAEDPPGRSAHAVRPVLRLKRPGDEPVASPASTEAAASLSKDASEPGHGAKIASIAMRTWIYVAPDDRSTKLGYLRAGAVIDRAEAPAGTDGCAGGWYRIAPRGYVCVGKGASLAIHHQVVEAAVRGPMRHTSLPYQYVIARSPPPHLYFRLPTRQDQERVEGSTLGVHLARTAGAGGAFTAPVDAVPTFLAEGRDLPKPYGAEEKLHYSVHAGRAREASAFGLITTFNWTGRRFGLTTELDLIPLDRARAAKPSGHRGIAIDQPGTPAFVIHQGVTALRAGDDGKLREDGIAPFRSGWVLTGKSEGGALGAMGDPVTTHATVRGTFLIHAKHVSATMDGDEATDSYDLRDVPYIQYFSEGYALHGAFWHDDFGKPRSHGCVNLAPADAAWLFEWTDPVVPPEWHGAVNAEGGTLVYTHG
jgi:hypothetical protein